MIGAIAGSLSRAWRAFPRPLAALLFAVMVFGICWALVIPAFDGPDEIQHYTYVETLAQRHKLPGAVNGSGPERSVDQAHPTSSTLAKVIAARHRAGVANPVSTAVQDTLTALNANGMTVGLAQPEQTSLAFARWQSTAGHQSQSDGGGTFPGSNYPPGYYAFDAIGYSLAVGGNVVDHLYAARLWSVLCLLLTTIGVWLLAGELTGGQRSMQLVAAAAVGLWPMVSFMSAMVNPDALLYASWTWTFWAMALVIRRGLTARRLTLLVLATAVAFLTKETSIALVPSVAFVVALGFWRLRGSERDVWQRPALVLVLLVGVPVGGWLALTAFEHRPLLAQADSILSGGVTDVHQFASYVWEYYLPRLPGQQLHDYYIPVVSTYPAYNIWVASGWGAFGWVTLYFPHGLYPWFLAITVLFAVGALARVGRAVVLRRGSGWLGSRALPLAVAFGGAAFLLLAGLHLTEYKLQSPTNQGRYLFPLAGFAGMVVALAMRWIPARLRPVGVGVLLGALVAFQLGSLGYVAAHYYA